MASDSMRQDLVDQVREEQQKRQRAPRVHRVPGTDRGAAPAALAAQDSLGAGVDQVATDRLGEMDDGAGDGSAPRKRRRRKRSGAGKTVGSGGAEGGGAAHSD